MLYNKVFKHHKGARGFITALALTATLSCLLAAFWIDLKAVMAQHLISKAWAQTLQNTQHGARFTQTDQAMKPWPWADTWPVAKLQFKQQEFYVLANASGHALAFGPAHLSQSALPGQGHTVIAAHKDTHFKHLEHVSLGEWIHLENKQGEVFHYQIYHTEIINSQTQDFMLGEKKQLTLITCYPFSNYRFNGPLRLLVHAKLVEKGSGTEQVSNKNRTSYLL